jgi:type IV pilus assembly protein PilQ
MVLSLTVAMAGCAMDKKAQKDPFFEKWSSNAEKYQGSSPVSKTRVITVPETISAESSHLALAGEGAAAEKSLPKVRVSLKMRQAEVKAVLRSLARTAGLNLLVKNDVKGEVSVDFREVPWDQAFNSILRTQGLSWNWEGEILRVMTVEDMEQELKFTTTLDKRKAQEMSVRWVESLQTVVVNIDYADARKLTDNLREFLTKDKEGKARGSVRIDEHSNALIIQAIKDDVNKMLAIIEKIDKPTPQIQIKANIVETSKDTARNLGIQWGGMYSRKSGNDRLFITPGGSAGSAIAPGSALSGQYTPTYGSPGISGQGYGINFPVPGSAMTTALGAGSLGLLVGTIGGNILEMQLTALQTDGKLNILSSPSITTLDNQKAYTENGEKVPYVSVDKEGNREVKFEDAVLRLEITPHVIDGKNLKMQILVKKDEVDLTRTVDGNPFIIKKQTETSLIVQDGETIVISGLSKQRRSDSSSGLPWLKDIPVLGWLFKSQSKSDALEEVLIFITPKILEQHADNASVQPEGVRSGQSPPLQPPSNEGGKNPGN